MKKKNNLSKKVAFTVANSLALLGITAAVNSSVTEMDNSVDDSKNEQFASNKVLKPQLVLKVNFEDPSNSEAYMHTSHASHASHASHSSHYSSSF